MNIGENIRKIRKNKKLTLKELGLKVELSEQAVGQYERGDRTPSIEILNRIAIALDISINDLLYPTNEEKLAKVNEFQSIMKNCFGEKEGIDVFQNKYIEVLKILSNEIKTSYLKNYLNNYLNHFSDSIIYTESEFQYQNALIEENIKPIIERLAYCLEFEIYKLSLNPNSFK